jgi:hypothetical protein
MVGPGAGAAPNCAPQSAQNLLSAGLDTPHLGHFISSAGAGGAIGCSGCGCGAAKLAPQSSQNKDPSGFSFPQEGFGHFIMIYSSLYLIPLISFDQTFLS